jgi:hypothetical protein
MPRPLRIVAALIVISLFSAFAQDGPLAITGTVVDPTGAFHPRH